MVGDLLYSRAPIDAATRSQLVELGHNGPFSLEVADSTPSGWNRVVAQIASGAKLLIVPRLTDLGTGSRQIIDRLAEVDRLGGRTYDPITSLLVGPEQGRAIIQVLSFLRRFDFERESAARSAGRRRASSPAPEPLCRCGHASRIHEKGLSFCWHCLDPQDNPKCARFEAAVPPQATATVPVAGGARP